MSDASTVVRSGRCLSKAVRFFATGEPNWIHLGDGLRRIERVGQPAAKPTA